MIVLVSGVLCAALAVIAHNILVHGRRGRKWAYIDKLDESRAVALLRKVHEDNLSGFMYSGPTREEVAEFLGYKAVCHWSEEPNHPRCPERYRRNVAVEPQLMVSSDLPRDL